MAILRSTAGAPMVAGGGPPLVTAPEPAAPAIVGGSDSLLFSMATDRPGVPGVNDQFERFGENRTWERNYSNPEGFAGVRWQPTWMRADGFYGSWEPAEGEIYRIRRKGISGQAAKTLEITTGPNTAPVPAGDSVVVWQVDGYNGGVMRSSTMDLSGYNMPMRTKMTVLASTTSAPWDANGRRTIDLDAGTFLPNFDYYVPSFDDNGTWQTMRLRHWSFYADRSTNKLRWPLPWFRDNSLELVLPNGGYVMLGGLQMRPTWRDWTLDWNDFGGSLVEELWKQECEGLAFHFGATDPRKLAVELSNEDTRPWLDGEGGSDIGYGKLLADVWYPVARTAWGKDRTLGVKATSFGSINSLRDDFAWTNPTGHNTYLFAHNYDGQLHLGGPGGRLAIWGDISETDYAAGIIADKIAQFGFKGGGMTEAGTGDYEWWLDDNGNRIPVSGTERGRRMGRLLTSLTNRGLSMFAWGMTGDGYNCVGVYQDGQDFVQKYFPDMLPYCVRAGRTTT